MRAALSATGREPHRASNPVRRRERRPRSRSAVGRVARPQDRRAHRDPRRSTSRTTWQCNRSLARHGVRRTLAHEKCVRRSSEGSRTSAAREVEPAAVLARRRKPAQFACQSNTGLARFTHSYGPYVTPTAAVAHHLAVDDRPRPARAGEERVVRKCGARGGARLSEAGRRRCVSRCGAEDEDEECDQRDLSHVSPIGSSPEGP